MIKIENSRVYLTRMEFKTSKDGITYLKCKGLCAGEKRGEEEKQFEQWQKTRLSGIDFFSYFEIYGEKEELDKLSMAFNEKMIQVIKNKAGEFEPDKKLKEQYSLKFDKMYVKLKYFNSISSTLRGKIYPVGIIFNYKFKPRKAKVKKEDTEKKKPREKVGKLEMPKFEE